jgi:hypothetical protein
VSHGAGRKRERETKPARILLRLLFPAGVPHLGPARVRLWVEDVSYADSAAVAVGHLDKSFDDATDLRGPYDVEARLRPGRSYAVRVFVSRSGGEQIAAGDLITTQYNQVDPADGGGGFDVALTVV